MITVTKKNEVYLIVDCDVSTLQEINDFFTFEVPGARFMPAYKSRMWDGKARLFNIYAKELPVGLLSYLEGFAKQLEYSISINIDVIGDPVSNTYIQNFTKELNLHTNGKSIEARDYQIEAASTAIRSGRQLLLSPTSSGKSLILFTLVRYYQRLGKKQLLIVPTTSLVEQMYGDFQDYASETAWQASENVHRIYGGKEKSNEFPITVSTWQSVYKFPKKWFEKFDVVYGDEAHLFKAKSLTSIMNKCENAPYRFGATGTLDGSKTHKLVLEGCFGPVINVTTTKKLMDEGSIAKLKVNCIVLQYPDEEKKKVKGMTYQEEMDYLVSNNKRNVILRNLTTTQKGNSLVLFQYVEKHGSILYDMIRRKVADGRQVYFVYGGTDTDQREQIRALTEKANDAIIVASYGTFSTGINIRNLHNVIFASPSKSRIRNLQSIGRGLRKGDDKTTCNLYDVGDDLSWKSKKNYTLNHMVERIKLYNEESFDYKIINLDVYGEKK
jgi:superfamily II DNA or RNA helicase|tara:strand:- start:455 stop:1945 length:1491 start_codon:yes stop_codon:yes gene_type:complete